MAVDKKSVKGEASSVVWVVGTDVSCGGFGVGVTAKRDASILIPYLGARVDKVVVKVDTFILSSCSIILAADFVFMLAIRSAANC